MPASAIQPVAESHRNSPPPSEDGEPAIVELSSGFCASTLSGSGADGNPRLPGDTGRGGRPLLGAPSPALVVPAKGLSQPTQHLAPASALEQQTRAESEPLHPTSRGGGLSSVQPHSKVRPGPLLALQPLPSSALRR